MYPDFIYRWVYTQDHPTQKVLSQTTMTTEPEILEVGVAVGRGTGAELADVFINALNQLTRHFSLQVKVQQSSRIYHSYQSLFSAGGMTSSISVTRRTWTQRITKTSAESVPLRVQMSSSERLSRHSLCTWSDNVWKLSKLNISASGRRRYSSSAIRHKASIRDRIPTPWAR